MSRVQPKSLPNKDRKELLDGLWFMIASLKTEEEVKNFFQDLLSETEAVMLARRIKIAKLLMQGMSYGRISDSIHASDGTIASVHRWLQSGFGGYQNALPRLEDMLKKKVQTKEKHREQKMPYSFEWLKKRYPLHFLLFNLFDQKK